MDIWGPMCAARRHASWRPTLQARRAAPIWSRPPTLALPALRSQLSSTLIAAPQNVLAKMVIDRVPSVEMVRFVNSGTEACLSVVRLMRAYTGREKVRQRVPE